MKHDLILFDMDGTLVDSKEGIFNSIAYALDFFGVKAKNSDEWGFLLGPPIRDGFRMLGDFTDGQVEGMVTKYREYFARKGMFESSLYPNVAEVLEHLKQNNVKMAVATSKVYDYAEKILSYFEIAQYFEIIVGAEMDGRRSEKPEIIAHALNNLDKNREMRTIMAGDRKYDVLGANAHSMPSIGCLWGYGSKTELEVAGVTHLAENITDILKIIS